MAGDPGGEIKATGLSQREVAEISFARWVGDLKCVVDALSHERFVLLGASQGAFDFDPVRSAQPGAGRRPGLVNRRKQEIAEKASAEGVTPLEVG